MKLGTINEADLSVIKDWLLSNGYNESEINSDNESLANLIVNEFNDASSLFSTLFEYDDNELESIIIGLENPEIKDAVTNKVVGILYTLEPEEVLQSSMNSQQFVDDAVQQAKNAGTIVTKQETDSAVARRLNITVPQLLTLRSLKEKDRLTLTKEMNTKDKSGKNAKTKVVKFVSFNEKFDKGMVFLEFPKLKGWLPMSMGASEFFRKTNTKVRQLTAAEVKAQEALEVSQQIAIDADEEVEVALQSGFDDNTYSLDGYDGTDELSSDSGVDPNLSFIDNYNLSDDEDDFVDYSGNDDSDEIVVTEQMQAMVAETPQQQQINNQQFIEQAIQQAQEAGDIVDVVTETDAQAAKRMNITVPQLLTLRSIPEKKLIPLKTPMSTKDRSGKSAKAKNLKFVSFNEAFGKGMVFLEYPHLKGWLVMSMGVSEFFRKTNVRIKK